MKFNRQSKPLTQRIQIAKARHKKIKGDEVLAMTSIEFIFAVFLQRGRSFIQQMRLISLQMRKMRRNLLILREFPLVKARKSLIFACDNSLHVLIS